MNLMLKQSLTFETHSFIFTLKGEVADDDMANALYESCNDSLLVSSNGVITMNFDRESPDLVSAINSAFLDVYASGYEVIEIEID